MSQSSIQNSQYNWKAIYRSLVRGNPELVVAVRVLHSLEIADAEAKAKNEDNKTIAAQILQEAYDAHPLLLRNSKALLSKF